MDAETIEKYNVESDIKDSLKQTKEEIARRRRKGLFMQGKITELDDSGETIYASV